MAKQHFLESPRSRRLGGQCRFPRRDYGLARAIGRRAPRHGQRGFGALAITLVLVACMAIGMLFANVGVMFEQRSAANLTQSETAFEAAEAGIEWATGMLNAPYDMGDDCAFLTTTNASFRKRYVLTKFNDATSPTTDIVPATNAFPGCKLGASGPSCNCPPVAAAGSTAVASLGTSVLPSFTVAFEAVAGDAESVKITSYGCTAGAAACSSTSFGSADGNARVSTILKLRPVLRALPSSPLTCGISCTIGGSYNVVNQDLATNGVLINAGTTISTGNGVSLTTLPGLPAANAAISNDASLAALSSGDPTCTNSQLFNAYFGSTVAQYQAAPSTKTLSCSSSSDCATQLSNAYNDGWRAFYFSSALSLSGNSSYGSRTDPVTIVTQSAISVNGNTTIYGLIFSNDANWNDLGTGSATIYGAQVSCAGYNNNGNGTLSYDAATLNNARRLTGSLVRVPGSWRDFRTNDDTLP